MFAIEATGNCPGALGRCLSALLWDHRALEHGALFEQRKDLRQLVKAAASVDDGAGADFSRAQNFMRALHVSRTKMER